MVKVYIAGPLYNESERLFNEKIAAICEGLDCGTFLPHRDVGLQNDSNGFSIYKKDLKGIINSDIIVANLNGCDVDSGTAWELGYGYAHHKYLIGVHTDMRVSEPHSEVNNMILQSTKIVHSLEEFESLLKIFIERYFSKKDYAHASGY